MPTPYELRYGNTVKQPMVESNEFIEGILKRKSLRRFDPTKKIPPELINYLMCAAQSAPSSAGAQSWSVIILETPEEKEKFRQAAGEALDGTDPNNLTSFIECSAFLIWIADNYKMSSIIDIVAKNQVPESMHLLEEFRDNPRYQSSLNSSTEPNKIFKSIELHREWLDQSNYSIRAMVDATIAAQTFSLCAESLGLGTLYMGSIAHCNLDSYKNALNLPPRTFPIFGMCIGYEHPRGTNFHGMCESESYMSWYRKNSDEFNIKPKQSLDIVIHRGKYNRNINDALKKYNSIVIEYYGRVKRSSDYFITKCIKKIHKTSDQLARMISMGNRWR